VFINTDIYQRTPGTKRLLYCLADSTGLTEGRILSQHELHNGT